MAVRAKAITTLRTFGDQVWIVTWEGLTQTTSDSGDPFEMPGAADRSVQVIGTFGTGGSVRIEGSNDGTNYATLADPSSTALNITAAGIEGVQEITRWIRPRVTAGDGATDLDVILLVRRAYP
jgi:hypothetical protein